MWHGGYIPVPSGYNFNGSIIVSAKIIAAKEVASEGTYTSDYPVFVIDGTDHTRETIEKGYIRAYCSTIGKIYYSSGGQVIAKSRYGQVSSVWGGAEFCVRFEIMYFI